MLTWVLKLRTLTIKFMAVIVSTFVLLNGCFSLPYAVSILLTFAAGVTWWRQVDSAWSDFVHLTESERGKQVRVSPNEAMQWQCLIFCARE